MNAPDLLVLIAERRERLDERTANRFLDVMLGLLLIVIVLVALFAPPPGR
jgi:hypothetical protein